ncbi:hypothetical protein ACFO25_01200 [Paenactinomyces guangxiensis]|uniref:Uncharacterized protein n=1 Tax=Paenactinomyces guangxiensis TaxID=1490290 RepID=A0A7W2A962_9BACL|nr:hypothetical protein [Paenactinomyces guangxiensis]MBA4495380.1 hypothetical protein [Paenactinomyces guangxiensis]MBH8592499.1 hypothetical protein [Paenactinomyces guangxiensis]
MNKTFRLNWNLDSIFQGGSNSDEFRRYLEEWESDMVELNLLLEKLDPFHFNLARGSWTEAIAQLESCEERREEAESFTRCLTSQNVTDGQAADLQEQFNRANATFQRLLTSWEQLLAQVPQNL